MFKNILKIIAVCSIAIPVHAASYVTSYLGDMSSPLVLASSAAFTVYANKYDADTTSATLKVYSSSIAIVCSSNGITNTQKTYTYNMLLSTSDTIADIINVLNSSMCVAAAVDGCYLLQNGTGSWSTTRVDLEGGTDGLQWSATGMDLGNILLVANKKTVYLNGTKRLSKYFPKYDALNCYSVFSVNCSTINSNMYLYEGDVSTNCTTAIAIPYSGINEKFFPEYAPLRGTNGKSLEFSVEFSTWVSMGKDMIQCHVKRGE